VTLNVIALADDHPAGFTGKVTVSNEVVAGSFGTTRDQFVFVSFEPSVRDTDAATKQLGESLSKRFPETETLTSQEFKQKTQDQVNQFLMIIFALLALAIIVAVFGIVNTLVLAITERTRELGLLRAIGTSRRQVRRMVRYESVITALIGTVIGTVVGSLLAVLVLQKVEDLAFAFPIVLLIMVLILGAIVGVFAAIWPARRASRLDVLQSLAHE
jgi:putative ABC transport system permease protein